MTRARKVVVSLLVIGILEGVGRAYAEREGSGSYAGEVSEYQHAGASLQDGASVELKGRITGNQLTVTEGPYADQRFELVENHAFEELENIASSSDTYRINGKVLSYRGTSRILISSYQRATTLAPTSRYQEKPRTTTQRSYREGS